jgi:hypothetical protein
MRLLTAAEIGAFLGITAAAVRQIVHRHRIEVAGKAGRANLYDPREVIRHAGPHDRRTLHDAAQRVSH